MKSILYPLFLGSMLCMLVSSCQKAYERPDLTDPATGGGGGSGTGSLLTKVETKTNGSTEGSTIFYEYDASSRLIKITTKETDSSNQSVTYYYRYARDASGKITKIVTNLYSAISPSGGFPDSMDINVHYAAGATNFDYTSSVITIGGTGGITFRDSIAYIYTNGNISDTYSYSQFSTQPMTFTQRSQYVYSNSNMVTQKEYDQPTATTPVGVYTYEYDSKTAALYLGNESFLPGLGGGGYESKNNMTKITGTDNSNGSVIFSVAYTLQYNAGNLPVTGTYLLTPGNKGATVKFTYQ
jgi:hypothetical protein